jgi:hypothetical protein
VSMGALIFVQCLLVSYETIEAADKKRKRQVLPHRAWRRLVRQIVIKYHLGTTRDLLAYLKANGYAEHVPMSSAGPYLQWLIKNDAEVRAELYV